MLKTIPTVITFNILAYQLFEKWGEEALPLR
jgi:hypothetical protein